MLHDCVRPFCGESGLVCTCADGADGEDRLLFDHQATPGQNARLRRPATYTLAVEQMMQRYYRTVMDLSRLNEMLAAVVRRGDPDQTAAAHLRSPLNERFSGERTAIYKRPSDECVYQ